MGCCPPSPRRLRSCRTRRSSSPAWWPTCACCLWRRAGQLKLELAPTDLGDLIARAVSPRTTHKPTPTRWPWRLTSCRTCRCSTWTRTALSRCQQPVGQRFALYPSRWLHSSTCGDPAGGRSVPRRRGGGGRHRQRHRRRRLTLCL